MSISIILWISSMTILLHKARPSTTIEVDLSAQVVRFGDNVTFICILTELGSKTVILNRVITQPGGNKHITEQIAINDDLNRLYKNLSRFSVVRSTAESADVFTLRITGVQLEDSGTYSCNVSVEDKFASRVLEVYTIPKILCSGIWNATLSMTNFEIRCRVYANPGPNSSDKHVTISEKGMMVKVNPGDDFQSYSLQDVVEKGTNGKIFTMIFTIKTVTEEHFNYTYTFYAQNSEGLTEKRIRIEQSKEHFNYTYTFYAQNSEGLTEKMSRIENSIIPPIDGAEGILKRRAVFPIVILTLFAILF